MCNMDIDKMVELGEEGKFEELEAIRESMYQEFIESVTDVDQKRKLQGLHFKVKNVKATCKGPNEAMYKSYSMMLESFLELNERLKQLKGL